MKATLRQIRPDLDPDTRSRSVVVTLPEGATPVLGDTVALLLTQAIDDPGFWAPLRRLREGVRGSWSVMAVEATDRRRPHTACSGRGDPQRRRARVPARRAAPRRADRGRGPGPRRPRPACPGAGGVTGMDTVFFRQPRLVMLALLVILSAGLSALVSIGRQEDPTITNIFATITTVFPGADPARVEALVTTKIETELRTIPEIAEVSSTSATGISVISVELVETVAPEIDRAALGAGPRRGRRCAAGVSGGRAGTRFRQRRRRRLRRDLCRDHAGRVQPDPRRARGGGAGRPPAPCAGHQPRRSARTCPRRRFWSRSTPTAPPPSA